MQRSRDIYILFFSLRLQKCAIQVNASRLKSFSSKLLVKAWKFTELEATPEYFSTNTMTMSSTVGRLKCG